MRAKERIHRGSGNVFADIGSVYPQRTLARAQIMFRIAEIIKERHLTQKKASELLGIPSTGIQQNSAQHGLLRLHRMRRQLDGIHLWIGCLS